MKLEIKTIKVEHEGGVFYFKQPNTKQHIKLIECASKQQLWELSETICELLDKIENVEFEGEDINADKFKEILDKLPGDVVLPLIAKAANEIMQATIKEAEKGN